MTIADITLRFTTSQPAASVWRRLLGPSALCATGTLLDRGEGDPFAVETALDELFSGTVVAHLPYRELVLRIDTMHGSILRLALAEEDTGSAVELALSPVRLHHDELGSFRLRWRHQLQELFPGSVVE